MPPCALFWQMITGLTECSDRQHHFGKKADSLLFFFRVRKVAAALVPFIGAKTVGASTPFNRVEAPFEYTNEMQTRPPICFW